MNRNWILWIVSVIWPEVKSSRPNRTRAWFIHMWLTSQKHISNYKVKLIGEIIQRQSNLAAHVTEHKLQPPPSPQKEEWDGDEEGRGVTTSANAKHTAITEQFRNHPRHQKNRKYTYPSMNKHNQADSSTSKSSWIRSPLREKLWLYRGDDDKTANITLFVTRFRIIRRRYFFRG